MCKCDNIINYQIITYLLLLEETKEETNKGRKSCLAYKNHPNVNNLKRNLKRYLFLERFLSFNAAFHFLLYLYYCILRGLDMFNRLEQWFSMYIHVTSAIQCL